MTLDDRHQELVDAMRGDVSPEDIAARAQAIRAKLTGQLAEHIAKARAAERDKCEQELAAALGVNPTGAIAWPTLISMVLGIRPIADLVVGGALGPDVDDTRRRELLVSFGVAEQWARVVTAAEMSGPSFRPALGLDDHGRPLGDRRNDPPHTSDGQSGTWTDPK